MAFLLRGSHRVFPYYTRTKINKKLLLTVVQYSCIGCAILWFLYLPPLPAKKQSWHMSKLKHLRQRYLGKKPQCTRYTQYRTRIHTNVAK